MFSAPSPFTLIAGRAQRLLDDLEARLQSGELSSRAKLLTTIIDAVSRFAASLASPSLFAPRMRKDELLLRESVTGPFTAAFQDLELAHDQIAQARQLTVATFNLCQAERAGLADMLAQAQASVDRYRLWITDSDPSFLWAGDTFNDTSHVDAASTIHHDVRAGSVTLKPIASLSLSDKVTAITLDKAVSFGGLPGCNLEIVDPGTPAFTGEDPEPRPGLAADRQPGTAVLTAVLDGNPDTWFEWERNYLDLPQPLIRAGAAFVYDPAGTPNTGVAKLPNWNCFLRWPGDPQVDTGTSVTSTSKSPTTFKGVTPVVTKTKTTAQKGYPLAQLSAGRERQTLSLGIQLALDQPRTASWLQLTPLIKGAAYPQVDQIWVSADGNTWKKLLSEPTVLNPRMNQGVDLSTLGAAASNFEGIGVWPMPAAPIQYVRIILSQKPENSLPMTLGAAHKFTLKAVTKKKKSGLFQKLGLTPAGTSTSIQRVVGPIPVLGSAQSTLGGGTSADFVRSESSSLQDAHDRYDILQGERQVIGIRDLLLEQRTYGESGQFLSTAHRLAQPGRAVALITTELIPADWPPIGPAGHPWISYEISVDGTNWQPIVPQLAQLDDSVVPFSEPAATLQLRATFTRPLERETESPALLAYALKVLT